MTLYDRLAGLDLTVTDAAYERLARDTSSGFERVTTVVTLSGDGDAGRGEDVTYDADRHDALAATPPALPLPFSGTFEEFSRALDVVDLFPGDDVVEESARHHRRWAFESAALDLALTRAGTDLASVLDRRYDPVRFVVSTRLGDPPTADRVRTLLDADSTLEFKLDPTTGWTPALADDLAATDRVRVLDLKGQYEGTEVDQPADPDLYELVVGTFPDAVIEDPALTAETRPILDAVRDRVSWDAPITGVDSLDALPWDPAWINVKPSRFGTVRSLLATVERCRDRGVSLYGGGQFELGPGREHLHTLASVFYPEAPNDVAPGGYNDPDPPADLPRSPLSPPEDPVGLGWS